MAGPAGAGAGDSDSDSAGARNGGDTASAGGADTGVLGRLQRGLEEMYRVDTALRVGDFVIDAAARDRLGAGRSPREQLLLTQDGDGLELALFVDEAAIANLNASLDAGDHARAVVDDLLGDFVLAIEGVSHFVYLVWGAHRGRRLSALELELQAEVDKYVTCLLTAGGERGQSARLRKRLFEQFAFEDDLDADERDRYRTANATARSYARSLDRRYVRTRRLADMLAELRRFYRMPLPAKLEFVADAA